MKGCQRRPVVRSYRFFLTKVLKESQTQLCILFFSLSRFP